MLLLLIAAIAILALFALNILQFILNFKERQKLLDRIQAKSFPEFKAFEAKEANAGEKKDAPEPPVYL